MNPPKVRLSINGQAVEVHPRASVAAAIAQLGLPFRRSPTGQWRAPLCGMGVCFECRVSIDGQAQQRACQVPVRPGMQVSTDG